MRIPGRDIATPAVVKARAFVGISGFDYPGWRGAFYPAGVPRREWLAYASTEFNSIELNGTFYSLKTPAVFRRWVEQVRRSDFVFAVKGGRFITHNLKLRNATTALANFFASGVLELGARTGPFLWQLPEGYGFDADRIRAFLEQLPRTSAEAATLARGHDHRLKSASMIPTADIALRHAFEVRHPSYFHAEFYELLREYGIAFVIADSAGRFPYAEEVTADFVYIRLHGSQILYVSGYSPEELDKWADRVQSWREGGRDVYVYFDNDAKVHAPHDARGLHARIRARESRRGGGSRPKRRVR